MYSDDRLQLTHRPKDRQPGESLEDINGKISTETVDGRLYIIEPHADGSVSISPSGAEYYLNIGVYDGKTRVSLVHVDDPGNAIETPWHTAVVPYVILERVMKAVSAASVESKTPSGDEYVTAYLKKGPHAKWAFTLLEGTWQGSQIYSMMGAPHWGQASLHVGGDDYRPVERDKTYTVPEDFPAESEFVVNW